MLVDSINYRSKITRNAMSDQMVRLISRFILRGKEAISIPLIFDIAPLNTRGLWLRCDLSLKRLSVSWDTFRFGQYFSAHSSSFCLNEHQLMGSISIDS